MVKRFVASTGPFAAKSNQLRRYPVAPDGALQTSTPTLFWPFADVSEAGGTNVMSVILESSMLSKFVLSVAATEVVG